MSTPIYIIIPPKASAWVAEVLEILPKADWADFELIPIEMDHPNDFRVDRVLPQILRRLGPAVVSDCAVKASQMLQTKLATKSVVCVRATLDSTDLWVHLDEARKRHLSGEPNLPRKYVAAVCVVRKLARRRFWGGTNDKNHLYLENLVKGGIPPQVLGVIHETINDLTLNGILVAKYGTQSNDQKYALNKAKMNEIDRIIKSGVFPEVLTKILMRDKTMLERSLLDWPDADE